MDQPYRRLPDWPTEADKQPLKLCRFPFLGPAGRRGLRASIAVACLIVVAIVHMMVSTLPSAPSSDLMIVMGDSRAPTVPMDPATPLPYVTITTLINYHYARQMGAGFRFVVYDAPDSPPPHNADSPVCHHPRHGWRAGSWCKLPAMWQTMREHKDTHNFMFIDTDAAFRSEDLSPERHIGHLTPFRPIGFLSNHPWDSGVCAGYFFLRREAQTFLEEWWDTNMPRNNLRRLWEQSAINQMLSKPSGSLDKPSYVDRIVHLRQEQQFKVADPSQMILHISSMEKNRTGLIQALWRNDAVPLTDRQALQRFLDEVPVQRVNISVVAEDMQNAALPPL